METVTGLVLSGGGARAAYQAGVLQGILRVFKTRAEPHPCYFSVITGFSAGAINGAFLAARIDRMETAVAELWKFWESVTTEKIFRTNVGNLTGIGLRWLGSLISSGSLSKAPTALLDTGPLKELIPKIISFEDIANNVRKGCIRGIAVSATHYHSGATVTFFDGKTATESYEHSLYKTVNTRLMKEHVLASCAIPIVFPAVSIDGSYFGDGGIRFSTPLSPAIHLGAERILAIGIRHKNSGFDAEELTFKKRPEPTLADIAGVVLDSVFMEALETDVSRAKRMNQLAEARLQGQKDASSPRRIFQKVPILLIQPSEDLGLLAYRLYKRFPAALKYLLRGVGATPERGSDFLSYLAFDKSYTRRLLKLGYADALSRKREILEFFSSPL